MGRDPVVVAAPSNKAVDNLARRVAKREPELVQQMQASPSLAPKLVGRIGREMGNDVEQFSVLKLLNYPKKHVRKWRRQL